MHGTIHFFKNLIAESFLLKYLKIGQFVLIQNKYFYFRGPSTSPIGSKIPKRYKNLCRESIGKVGFNIVTYQSIFFSKSYILLWGTKNLKFLSHHDS